MCRDRRATHIHGGDGRKFSNEIIALLYRWKMAICWSLGRSVRCTVHGFNVT